MAGNTAPYIYPDPETLQRVLKDRLSPLSALGYEVDVQPEAPANYVKAFRVGRFTIAYQMSDFVEPFVGSPKPQIRTTPGTVSQTENYQVEIILESRKLYGDGGVYHMRREAQKLLLGWRSAPFSRIYLIRFSYQHHGDGIWTYSLVIGTTSMLVGPGTYDDDLKPVYPGGTLVNITEITTTETPNLTHG